MYLWEAMQERRSIRKFKGEPVHEEILLKLAKAASLAPSNGNNQPWDFVFITQPELVNKIKTALKQTTLKYWSEARTDALKDEKLQKTVAAFTEMGEVPVFVLACLNPGANRMHPEYREWNNLWNHHSVTAAFMNLILAAEDEGLGTCWLATTTWGLGKLRKELGIPEEIQIIAVSPIGYAAEAPKPRPRKPLEEVVHFNKW